MNDIAQLCGFLQRLKMLLRLPLVDFPAGEWTPESLGLLVVGHEIRCPETVDFLAADPIRSRLEGPARAWLRRLDVLLATDSTNLRLTEIAQTGSADGVALLAELQIAGRGRRGRTWQSPFGANLALSLGYHVPGGGPGRFEGLSLAVGIGVIRALERAGVARAMLKWPNDIQVDGGKLCGILIELVTVNGGIDAIVGIGINVTATHRMRAAIGQPVAALRELGVTADRSTVAALVISHVTSAVEEFRRDGFGGMRAAYDACHVLHNRECEVILATHRVRGRVVGVSASGRLRLATAEGEREFDGGEVSLRASAADQEASASGEHP